MIGILMAMALMVGIVGCETGTEVVTETDSQTGEVIEEYEIYSDGESNERVKHGYYKSYYENGEIWKAGNYESGTKARHWVSYHDNGQIMREGNYKSGTKDGQWVGHHDNGII